MKRLSVLLAFAMPALSALPCSSQTNFCSAWENVSVLHQHNSPDGRCLWLHLHPALCNWCVPS